MLSKDFTLKPHPLFEDRTFEEHCSKIPEFWFKDNVPEDVKLNFEVIEKLLAFSYYEYKFIDEAFSKALRTLEMSMKIKAKELKIYKEGDMFALLSKKLVKANCFESNYDYLNHFKNTRNWDAHPERHSFAGAMLWSRFKYITFLINELYEDVGLRLKRKQLLKNLEHQIESLSLNNNLVIDIGDRTYILHKLKLLFVNNKLDPHSYLFACTPLFDLIIENGSASVPYVFKSKLTSLNILNGYIEGISYENKINVKLSPIKDYPDLIQISQSWYIEYSKLNEFIFDGGQAIYTQEIYDNEIMEFQKM